MARTFKRLEFILISTDIFGILPSPGHVCLFHDPKISQETSNIFTLQDPWALYLKSLQLDPLLFANIIASFIHQRLSWKQSLITHHLRITKILTFLFVCFSHATLNPQRFWGEICIETVYVWAFLSLFTFTFSPFFLLSTSSLPSFFLIVPKVF